MSEVGKHKIVSRPRRREFLTATAHMSALACNHGSAIKLGEAPSNRSPNDFFAAPSTFQENVQRKIPIVLHHGLFGFGQFQAGPLKLSYFHGINRAIAQRGHAVLEPRVHPTAGIQTRACQLKQALLQQMEEIGAERVVIIAHSMGGLDARFMISRLGMADRVAALATVSAPHRGSAYADWFVKHLGERLGGFNLTKMLGLDVQAAHDLTRESCRRFNDEVPDAPGVRYYSVGACRPWRLIPAFALLSYKVIYDAEGDNDGLVSVASSRWGKHLGVWPADHFHTVNKRLVLELKNPTGDIAPYYLRLLDAIEA